MITIQNSITLNSTPQVVYNYVTQPWFWHDWHPSSVSAQSNKKVLQTGDTFLEEIKVHPLSPLPLELRRKTKYEVIRCEPYKLWQVKGILQDGWLKILYEFIPIENQTLFKRTLTFEITGYKKFFLPYLLKRRMEKLSPVALENLKKKLESNM